MDLFEPDLEKYFLSVKDKDPRVAAEIAYALAVLYEGQAKGRDFALQSIALFESIGVNSLDDASSRYTMINNIPMPDLIHEGVVKARFHIN
jgi:hypothetical protein